MTLPYTQLYVHLVWATWDRQPWITDAARPSLHAAIVEKCKVQRCQPVAVGGVADHVHVLVRMRPSIAISDLVGALKGASSYWMNACAMLTETFRWQGSYGALSVHSRVVARVARYVHDQPFHHARQKTLPRWQQTHDEA